MQAVILAGGLGTRLRPLTELTPKPMVEVCGLPFLEYIVRHLAQQDFRELLLLVGYLGEKVRDYFQDGHRFGVSIDYSWERAPLGTGGAIRGAWEKLASEFLLLYGDSFLPIDYRHVAAAFSPHRWQAMAVIYDNCAGDTDVRNNICIDGTGMVTRYDKGGDAPDLSYVEAGVVCLRREAFAAVPADSVVSLEQDMFPKLIANRQLGTFQTTQRFYDIGTPARLQEFAALPCLSLARHSA